MKLFLIITITVVLIIYSVVECEAKGGRGGGRSSGRGGRGHSSYHGSYHGTSHGRTSSGRKTGHGGHSSISNHYKNSFGSRRGGQGFWNSFTSIPFFSRFKLFGGKTKPSKSSSPAKDINNNAINANSKNDISKTNNLGDSKSNNFDDIGKNDMSKLNNFDDKPSSVGQSGYGGYGGYGYHHSSHHHTDSRRRQGHNSTDTTTTPIPIETTTSISQWMDELSKQMGITTQSTLKTKYEFPKFNERFPDGDSMNPILSNKALKDVLEKLKEPLKLTPD